MWKAINDKFEEVASIAILAFAVILVFAQVLARYVFKESLPWSEELARYLFLWLIWMGAAWATKERAHISLDVLTSKLKGKPKRVVGVIALIIWILFAILLAYLSIELTSMIFIRGQVSTALQMPMGIAYASVSFGMVLMVLRLIQNIVHDLKAYRLKEGNAE